MSTAVIEQQDTFRIGGEVGSTFQSQTGMSSLLNSATGLKDVPREEIKAYLSSFSSETFQHNDRKDWLPRTSGPDRLGTPPVFIAPARPPTEKFCSLQKWEGIVEEVKSESFVARLIDITAANPDEEAEFAVEDVPVSDRDFIAPGAVFYWNLGYLDNRHGQRYRASLIRFRRLPSWTDAEIEEAREEAERIADVLKWK